MTALMRSTIGCLIPSIVACTIQKISYRMDIEPILNEKCIKCHAPPYGIGYKKTGLNMLSYDSLIDGTIYGPVIVAGDSKRSIINMLAEGRVDKLEQNNHGDGKALSSEEIQLLKLWVDQGASNN